MPLIPFGFHAFTGVNAVSHLLDIGESSPDCLRVLLCLFLGEILADVFAHVPDDGLHGCAWAVGFNGGFCPGVYALVPIPAVIDRSYASGAVDELDIGDPRPSIFDVLRVKVVREQEKVKVNTFPAIIFHCLNEVKLVMATNLFAPLGECLAGCLYGL